MKACDKMHESIIIYVDSVIFFGITYILVSDVILRERDHWGDPDADGRIILRWIFRKWEGIVGNGWSWLRIGTGGGHL